MTKERILEINNLSVTFRTDTGLNLAIDDISVSLNRGETLGIVGESGSGKSTTALAIMKLIPMHQGQIQQGQIWFTAGKEDVDIVQYPEEKMEALREARIAMIFQEPMTSLNPVFRCGDQVIEAIIQHQKVSKSVAREETIDLFREVRLPDPEEMVDRYPHQLSGGQKQRVMIAMALSCNPDILIADEPTSALDVTVQSSILDILNDLQRKRGMSIIFISHDLGVVAEVADYVAVMYRGKIVEHGSVWDIFAKPKHPYTKGLLTCRPPLKRRLTYLPTISDFMDERQDKNGKWVVKEKSHTSMKEILSSSAESLDAHTRRVEALQRHEPILSIRHLKTYFPGKRDFFGRTLSWTRAVDDVSFDVYPGETLGLVGESGCGKTTLARTVLRLIEPTDGQIFFKGQDLTGLTKEELRRLRQHIQIIFQDPYSSLNPRMTIGAILTEPMKVHGMFDSKSRRLGKAVEIMEKVRMDASHLVRYPHEFSGGQRQRICIARALVLEPELLICDEPVSALDVSIQAQVLNLLSHLKGELNLTYIFISHDLAVVKFMSDRIMVMNMGKTEEIGPAEEIYNNPQRNYTKKLIAATPVGGLEDIKRQQSRRGRPEAGSH